MTRFVSMLRFWISSGGIKKKPEYASMHRCWDDQPDSNQPAGPANPTHSQFRCCPTNNIALPCNPLSSCCVLIYVKPCPCHAPFVFVKRKQNIYRPLRYDLSISSSSYNEAVMAGGDDDAGSPALLSMQPWMSSLVSSSDASSAAAVHQHTAQTHLHPTVQSLSS